MFVLYICFKYHIIFIHSSVIGHLGCFHVLAIINSFSVNTGVHVSFWIIVFSGMGLLDHMATLCLVFWETAILFSIVAALIYIPTKSVGGFPFLQHIRVLLRVMHPMGLDKCIMTCIHHYSIMQNSFTALKILCAPPIHPHLFPSPDNYLSFYCLHSFAFSRMSCSWNCTVCSLFFKFLFYLFFGCVGSSLLHTGFL